MNDTSRQAINSLDLKFLSCSFASFKHLESPVFAPSSLGHTSSKFVHLAIAAAVNMARWLPSCIALALLLALFFPLRPVHADDAKTVHAADGEKLDEEEIVNRFLVWAKERGLTRILEEDSPTEVGMS